MPVAPSPTRHNPSLANNQRRSELPSMLIVHEFLHCVRAQFTRGRMELAEGSANLDAVLGPGANANYRPSAACRERLLRGSQKGSSLRS